MYENNSFITLTYSDENLRSPKLQYIDFQLFAKRLRDKIFREFIQSFGEESWRLLDKSERLKLYEPNKISIFVCGEYGDENKRPHWHALIFNWAPKDLCYKYSNSRGDKVYSSEDLGALWGNGIAESGSITQYSANYCARYAAKKLSHGQDQDHDYHPIARRSSKQAIGKKFIEKHWPDVFNNGFVLTTDGQKASVPKYYERWLKKNLPDQWVKYISGKKLEIIKEAQAKEELLSKDDKINNLKRSGLKGLQISRNKTRDLILKQKFEKLQNHKKL